MTDATQTPDDKLDKALVKTPVFNMIAITTAIGVVFGAGIGFLSHKAFKNSRGLWRETLPLAGTVGVGSGATGYAMAITENNKIDQLSPHISRLQAERDEAKSKLTQVEGALHPEAGGVGRG